MQFGLQKSRALFIKIDLNSRKNGQQLSYCFRNAFWLCFQRIDKIYWFCISSFAANFKGLELHSSPARLQKLLNLEKLSYYLRMQKQKLKEFRVCTNISCSNIMERGQQRAVRACSYQFLFMSAIRVNINSAAMYSSPVRSRSLR